MAENINEILSEIIAENGSSNWSKMAVENGSSFHPKISADINSPVKATLMLGISEFELWLQLIVFYLLMAAVVGTGLNVYVAVCVIKSRKLRSRFYAMICFWLFTRASVALQYLIVTPYRILRTFDLVSSYLPRIACHSLHLFLYYSGVTEIYLLVFMVIDRIVAISKPNFYRLLSVRQALVVSSMIEILNIFINLIPSYTGVSATEVIQCLNVLSPLSKSFERYHELGPIVVTALLVLLQFLAIGLTCSKVRHLKRQSGESEQVVFLRRQVAMMAALRNMVFGHAGLTVATRLLVLCAGFVPSQSARLIAYSGMVQSFDIFTGPLILLWSNKELRRACATRCKVGVDEEYSRTIRAGRKSFSQYNAGTAHCQDATADAIRNQNS